jgi:hypothetical protein
MLSAEAENCEENRGEILPKNEQSEAAHGHSRARGDLRATPIAFECSSVKQSRRPSSLTAFAVMVVKQAGNSAYQVSSSTKTGRLPIQKLKKTIPKIVNWFRSKFLV